MTPGLLFKKAIEAERPLQVIGAINAYHAKLQKKQDTRRFIYQVVELQLAP